MDGHEACWGDDGRDGCPDGLDDEILCQDEKSEGDVGEEEGADEEEAVEAEVGKYDGEGNYSAL